MYYQCIQTDANCLHLDDGNDSTVYMNGKPSSSFCVTCCGNFVDLWLCVAQGSDVGLKLRCCWDCGVADGFVSGCCQHRIAFCVLHAFCSVAGVVQFDDDDRCKRFVANYEVCMFSVVVVPLAFWAGYEG